MTRSRASKLFYASAAPSRWAYAVINSAEPDLSHCCLRHWKSACVLPRSPKKGPPRGGPLKD